MALDKNQRAWYQKLYAALASMGFVSVKSDFSMFVQSTYTSMLIVLVYTNETLITSFCNA